MNPYLEIILRITFSIFSGVIIGFERKQKGKPAGITTNTLVCLGATILSIFQQLISSGIQTYGFSISNELSDISGGRIIAQIISGIGFLGAGTILRDNKSHVTGITTAAMLWIMACLGIIIGYGFWFFSLISFIAIVFVVFTLKEFNVRVIDHKNRILVMLTCDDTVNISTLFDKYDISVNRYKVIKIQKKEDTWYRTIEIMIDSPSYIHIKKMIDEISHIQGIYHCTHK